MNPFPEILDPPLTLVNQYAKYEQASKINQNMQEIFALQAKQPELALLTHLSLMEFPSIMNWTSPSPF